MSLAQYPTNLRVQTQPFTPCKQNPGSPDLSDQATYESISRTQVLVTWYHPLLILQPHIARIRTENRLALILPLVPEPYTHKKKTAYRPANDNRDLGRDIARGVFGEEYLGALSIQSFRVSYSSISFPLWSGFTDDIPSAISNQIQRRNGRLLRVPGHIRRD